MKLHYSIVSSPAGTAEKYEFKKWVRENLVTLPPGLDPESQTSHFLRRQLKKNGWKLNVTSSEVYVIKPDSLGSFAYAIDYLNNPIMDEDEEQELEDAYEITFGLEKDLQQALRNNIQQLEDGLQIIDGGKERNTPVGRIDICTKDKNESILVIELKAVEAKPDVIAQILGYMQAIHEEEQKPVRGIIIASDFPDRVKFAARQIPSLKLIKYNFQFTFENVN